MTREANKESDGMSNTTLGHHHNYYHHHYHGARKVNKGTGDILLNPFAGQGGQQTGVKLDRQRLLNNCPVIPIFAFSYQYIS